MSIRHAVLLVGGKGTRLWPLTATVPKALMPVAGVPFIEFQLRMLAEIGVEEAWLAVGVEHAVVWQSFVDGWSGAPALHVAVEDEPLDTAGPVTSLLGSLDDRFLVLNGDVTLDASLSDFIAHAPSVGAALVLVPVADPSAYGVVVLDDDGFVERFVEKPAPGLAPANTVNAGVYLVERRALEAFEQGPLSFERRVFPDLAAHKELGGVVLDGLWLDIGTPDLYLNTHEMLLSDGSRLYEADGRHGVGAGAVVDGECHGSWSWIGAGATVSHGASIKESVILPGARIESGARVTRSVVGWDAVVSSGASVSEETLIGRRAAIGAGCELRGGMRIADGTVLGERAITFQPPR